MKRTIAIMLLHARRHGGKHPTPARSVPIAVSQQEMNKAVADGS